MSLTQVPEHPLQEKNDDHKFGFFSLIRKPAFRFIGVILFFILLAVILLAFRHQALSIPFVVTVISFFLFLFPGATLSFWFLPNQSIFETLSTAFTFSVGLMVLPGLVVLIAHLNLAILLWIFIFMEACAVIACILLFFERFKFKEANKPECLHPLYFIIIAGFLVALSIISLQVPLIGDDWQGMTLLQGYLVSEHLNLVEPFHGTDYPPTARSEYGVWGLDFAILIKMSGLDPITYYHYLRPFMLVVAVSALYLLARRIFNNSTAAAFVVILFMLIVLVTISWDDTGYDLLVRINQDKFALKYIIMPVAFGFLISYFSTYRTRDLILFGITAWAAGGTHPMGPVLIGLPCIGFGLIHLAIEHNPAAIKHLLKAALCLFLGLVLPLLQFMSVGEDWLAFDLQGTLDPNLLTRLSMATRTEHLLLQPNGNYALHPAVFLTPVILISLLGIPYLISQLRESISARLLLGTLVFVPAILYFPPTGRLIGRLVTPWLLYRLAWSISLASILIIGKCLWDSGTWIFRNLLKLKTTGISSLLPLPILILILLILAPTINKNRAYLEDVSHDPQKAQCQDVEPLLTQLNQLLKRNQVILANHDLNFCIPAFSPYAKVIEYRWTTTISRFPIEHRDEAIQRLKDVSYYSSAHFVDQELIDIFDRYDVSYILLEEDEPLLFQLEHMSNMFEPVIQDEKFVLFHIKEGNTDYSLINANTYMMQGNWFYAASLYNNLLSQDADTKTLAHVGLSEIYLKQGLIEKSIDELRLAAAISSTDEHIWEILAKNQVAAGRYDEAIAAYNKAYELAPSYSGLLQQLGRTYLLVGKIQEAETSFKKEVGLLAPEGSSRWYRLLGDEYVHSKWNTKALDAYHQALTALPGDISLEMAIGDIYLRNGDLDLAKSVYEKARRIDHYAAEPISRLGVLAEKSGNLTDAIQKYRQAVGYKPVSISDYSLLAGAIEKDQDSEAALEAIKSLPGYHLSLPGPLLISGILYQNQGRYEEALSEYETAIERFPVDTGIEKVALGSLLAITNQWDPADINLKEALYLEPSITSDIYIELGKVQSTRAQSAEATGFYYQAIRVDPLIIAPYLELGNEYEFQANPTAALDMYEKAISIQPYSLKSMLDLADYYCTRGEFDASLQIYRQISERYPDELEGYLGLTRVYQILGRMQEAIQAYEQASQADRGSPPSLRLIQQGFQLYGDNELASAQYLLAVKSEHDSLIILTAYGYYLISQNQIDKAEKTFRSAIQLEPTNGRSRIGLATVLLISGSYDDALTQLQTAVESGDQKGSSYLALGNEFYRRGNIAEAIAAYKSSITIDPTSVGGYLQLGKIYEGKGEWSAAQNLYQEAIRYAPASGAAYTAFSRILTIQGDLSGAMKALEAAIKIEPDYVAAYPLLGQLLIASGQPAKTKLFFEQAVQQMPGSAAMLMASASFEYERGQPDEALKILQHAVEIEPGSTLAWLELGSLHQKLGNIKEAENGYLTAMKLEPGNPDIYIHLGDLYRQQAMWEDAQKFYEWGADVDQSRAQAYLKLGALHFSRGLIDRSIADLQQAIIREPLLEQSYLQLGNIYESQGDFSHAVIEYKKAIEVAPTSAEAFMALGSLEKKLGQWDESLNNYLHAVQIAPSDLSSWIGLGDFYVFRGDFWEAEKAYLKAIEVNKGTMDGYMHLGQLYQELRKTDKALYYFKLGIAAAPGSSRAYIALGKYYQDQGDWDLAEQSYKLALDLEIMSDGYLALGELSELRADDKTAELYYIKGLNVAPSDIRAYLAISKLKDKQGNRLNAEISGQQVIALAPSIPDGYIQLSNLYLTSAQWDKALKVLEEGVKNAPGSAAAHLSLGKLYLRFHQLDNAKEQFEKAISLDCTLPDSYVSMANLFLQTGDPDNAIQVLHKAADAIPTSLDVYITLGEAYWIKRDASGALSAYTLGIQKSLDIPGAFIARGDFYIKQGNWTQAQVDLETAWDLNPNSQDIGIRLANFYVNRSDFEKATAILSHLMGLKNATYQVYTAFGNLFSIKADWETAREAFDNAIEQGGEITDAFAGLARINELLGNEEEVIKNYQEAVQVSPQDSQAWINLGDDYQQQFRRIEAKQAYESAIQSDPLNMTAYIKLDQLNWIVQGKGIDLAPLLSLAETVPSEEVYTTVAYLYQVRGDLRLSLSWYQEATNYDPFNSNSWLALGDYYRVMNQWDLALNAYQQAYQLTPWFPDVNTSIGLVYQEINKNDAALEYFRRAVEAAPFSWKYQFTYINLLLDLSRSSEALSFARQWSTATPGIEQEYIIMGAIYSKVNNPDSALKTYQSGINLMPGSALIYEAIGDFHKDRILEFTSNLQESETFFAWAEVLLSKFQKSIDYLNSSRGWRLPEDYKTKIYDFLDIYTAAVSRLYYAERDYSTIRAHYDEGVAAYQHAIKLQPNETLSFIGLGQLNEAIGESQKALAYYQQAVDIDPISSLALFFLGNAYLEAGDPLTALPLFRAAVFHDPEMTPAHVGLYKSYRTVEKIEPSQAAEAIEHGQYTWEFLINNIRTFGGY